MCPEFNREEAKRIIEEASICKFVREGVHIWVEPASFLCHRDIVEKARFKAVDDAGTILSLGHNEITILGCSLGYATREDGPARDKTIEIARKAAGDSVEIIKI